MAEPWTAPRVAERLADAADTLARLPEARLCGYYSLWPPVVRSARETLGGGGGRMRSIPPAPEAIDRMDEALAWLGWLEPDEARLVWLRAEGVPWKPITGRLGVGRTTAWHRWTVALLKVATRLNAEDERSRSNITTLNKPARSVLQTG